MSRGMDRRPLADVSNYIDHLKGSLSASAVPWNQLSKPLSGRHSAASEYAVVDKILPGAANQASSTPISTCTPEIMPKTMQSLERSTGEVCSNGEPKLSSMGEHETHAAVIVTPKKRRISHTDEDLEDSVAAVQSDGHSGNTHATASGKPVKEALFMSPPRRHADEAPATPNRILQTPPRSQSRNVVSGMEDASQSTGRRRSLVVSGTSPSRENLDNVAPMQSASATPNRRINVNILAATDIFDDFAKSSSHISESNASITSARTNGLELQEPLKAHIDVPAERLHDPCPMPLNQASHYASKGSSSSRVSFRDPPSSGAPPPVTIPPQTETTAASEPLERADMREQLYSEPKIEVASVPKNVSSEAKYTLSPPEPGPQASPGGEKIDMQRMKARYSQPTKYLQPIELAPISEFHASVAAASSLAIRSLLHKRYYDEAKQKMESPVESSPSIEFSPIFDENTPEGAILFRSQNSTSASPSSVSFAWASPPTPANRYMPIIMPTLKNKTPAICENKAFREKLSLWRHQYGSQSPDYSIRSSARRSEEEENNIGLQHPRISTTDVQSVASKYAPLNEPSFQGTESNANTSFWRQRWEKNKSSHTTASALITASLETSARRDLRPTRHPLQDIQYNDASSISKLTHLFESKLSATGDA